MIFAWSNAPGYCLDAFISILTRALRWWWVDDTFNAMKCSYLRNIALDACLGWLGSPRGPSGTFRTMHSYMRPTLVLCGGRYWQFLRSTPSDYLFSKRLSMALSMSSSCHSQPPLTVTWPSRMFKRARRHVCGTQLFLVGHSDWLSVLTSTSRENLLIIRCDYLTGEAYTYHTRDGEYGVPWFQHTSMKSCNQHWMQLLWSSTGIQTHSPSQKHLPVRHNNSRAADLQALLLMSHYYQDI